MHDVETLRRERHAEERRERVRNLKALVALGLWAGGCGALYLAWNATQSMALPARDALATVIYLITFFYVFAFWPIHQLVERWFPENGTAARAPDSPQKP